MGYSRPHDAGIKSKKLIAHSEYDFTVERIVDGKNAAAAMAGENRKEDVHDSMTVYPSLEGRAIYVEHSTNAGETPMRYWITLPGPPLRIRAWAESSGHRWSSDLFAGYMGTMLNSFLPCEGSVASTLGANNMSS